MSKKSYVAVPGPAKHDHLSQIRACWGTTSVVVHALLESSSVHATSVGFFFCSSQQWNPGLHLLRKSRSSLSGKRVGAGHGWNFMGPWFAMVCHGLSKLFWCPQNLNLTNTEGSNKTTFFGNLDSSRFYIRRIFQRTTTGCFSGLPLSQALLWEMRKRKEVHRNSSFDTMIVPKLIVSVKG
jgi:hypothetical protein